MTPPDNTENLIRQFCTEKTSDMETRREFDKRTLQDAREAQSKSTAQSAAPASDLWKSLPGKNIPRLAAAALVLIAILLGIYSLPVSISTPAFADVMKNMLSQKWIYMFEEDRKSGHINWDCWYNPAQQRLYSGSRRGNRPIHVVEMTSEQIREYRDGEITIRRPTDSENIDEVIRRYILLGDLPGRYELEGAHIVQRQAVYNSQPALLYEIEVSFPDDGPTIVANTSRYSWLVDRDTHLPIICEKTRLIIRDSNEQGEVSSSRYAFDYSDVGPRDIYDLGVPRDANIVDERPQPEIQALIDSINQARETTYSAFAAVIVKEDRVDRLVIRDGRRLRSEYFELNINRSDWEPKRQQYVREMGDTFDSIYKWLGQTDIMIQQDITIADELFRYRTSGWDIRDDDPVRIGRRHGNHDEFSSYCWRWAPGGRIVETPYSRQNNLICTLNGRWYRYYDPANAYMCVRVQDEEGSIDYRVVEFSRTASGLSYPSKIYSGRYRQRAGSDESMLHDVIYIYARDLNDQLRAQLDPRTLPNYVDHRKLTREMALQREEATSKQQVVEYTGFTPLHMAIYRQDMEKVKRLLRQGAEVEPVYDSGATPMELAVASGSLEMVRLLYEYRADFISNDDEHRDALGLAVKEGRYEIAQFMLSHGSDVNAVYKHESPHLNHAAANGDPAMVKLLLANGAQANCRDGNGRTALYNAVAYLAGKLFGSKPVDEPTFQAFEDVINTLLDNGADINARDSSERTPMSCAIASPFCTDDRNAEQQLEFLRFLLNNGADPDADAGLGINSSFYRAAKERRYDIVEVLLEGGADPWLVVDHEHWPAKHCMLYFAHQRKDQRLYDLLYPYMRERYERTRAEIVEITRRVLHAAMQKDRDAIKALCIDHPHHLTPWQAWTKKIREFYQGREELFEKTVPGWFTLDGWAEAYVPLPEGMAEKSVLLGFLHCPDGRWRCILFQTLSRMHNPDRGDRGCYFLPHSHTLFDVRNYL